MIKAIIFDCFGVLVSDALQVIHGELKAKDPASAAEVTQLVRAANKGALDPTYSSARVAEILGVTVEEYRAKIRDGEVKDIRMLDLARQLRREYKTGILSNISATGLERRFTEDELRDCFDAVVSSGEIGYAKPEPEAYEIAAERLGVRQDECVFTDDRPEFCAAARNVGMQAIEFKDYDQFRQDLNAMLQRGR